MRTLKLIFCIAAISFVSEAQNTVKPKTTAPEKKIEKPVESEKAGIKDVSYLDLIHAREKALKLKDDNLRDIQRLNSIAAAFPEAVSKGETEAISAAHKDALKMVYRQEFVPAEKSLRENREAISKAFASASEAYRKKTGDMLNASADRMADLDMQAENTGSAESIRMAGVVQRNQHRLNVGYQQLGQAVSAEKHRRYGEALSHYKLARLHAIYLMIELAKDENEKQKIRNDYRAEIDDKLPVKNEGAAEKPAAASPKPGK